MRVLIPNRGEVVKRLARTLSEQGHTVIGVHSECDASLDYLQHCDEVYSLPGKTVSQTYIDEAAMMGVIKLAKIDAVHPGYGFLAESQSFSQRVIDSGTRWLGPAPAVIGLMGDKMRAKTVMADAGVAVLPTVEVGKNRGAAELRGELDYPVIVKPSGGGGGIGMQIVLDDQGLEAAIDKARGLSTRLFGSSTVFIEPYVMDARHVEVQLLGDSSGRISSFGTRDCSLQRRHQKVIEEAVASVLPQDRRDELVEMAVRGASAIDYQGLGTMEFLWDTERQQFSFLEMNTRLQVEHSVTEVVYGVDLVAEHLTEAEREEPLDPGGHAIEVRIYAEDPVRFIPSPGTLTEAVVPEAEDLRVDFTYSQGDVITPFYDPMIGKLTVHASSRGAAIARMLEMLTAVRIAGVKTNIPLLSACLQSEAFIQDRHTTRTAEQIAAASSH